MWIHLFVQSVSRSEYWQVEIVVELRKRKRKRRVGRPVCGGGGGVMVGWGGF